ncbi:MAG: PAS domain-containing protein, partial [Candidatus Woesearchaeota archaeon]
MGFSIFIFMDAKNTKKTEHEVCEQLLLCDDFYKCMSILETNIKEESGLDSVHICIFDRNVTMQCVKIAPNHVDKLNDINHFSFNCILYNLKNIPSSIIDANFLKKQKLPCTLVSNFGFTFAYADINTYKKIGIVLGCNKNGKKITDNQLEVLRYFSKKYTNIINTFRRLEERKDKIEFLTFLSNINKNISVKTDTSMTNILSMIVNSMNFDMCAHIKFKKGFLPKNMREATRLYYTKENITDAVFQKMKKCPYPSIDKINESLLKGEVFGSSFTYIGAQKYEVSEFFDEFVIIPLNEIEPDFVNFIICLNWKNKKGLNKATISNLQLFRDQIVSALKNSVLVKDIKEDYNEMKELYNLTNKFGKFTSEKKIIEKYAEDIAKFFYADSFLVFRIEGKENFLHSKNINFSDDPSFILKLKSIYSENKKSVLLSNNKSQFLLSNPNDDLIQTANSQIVLFITLRDNLDYVFIFQSKMDYTIKKKYETLFELIVSTIEKVLENARMHEEILNYNKSLLSDKQSLSETVDEGRQKLFNIVNGMDEPLIAINSDKKIEIFNDASENLFGLDKEDIVGHDAKIFVKRWKIPINLDNIHFKHKIFEYALN